MLLLAFSTFSSPFTVLKRPQIKLLDFLQMKKKIQKHYSLSSNLILKKNYLDSFLIKTFLFPIIFKNY